MAINIAIGSGGGLKAGVIPYCGTAITLNDHCRLAALCMRGWAWFSLSISAIFAITYAASSGVFLAHPETWLWEVQTSLGGSHSLLAGLGLLPSPTLALVTLALAGEAIACWFFSTHLITGSRYLASLAMTALTLLAGVIAWSLTLCVDFVGYTVAGDWTQALTMPESGVAVSSALFGCGLAYTIYLLWEIFLFKKA